MSMLRHRFSNEPWGGGGGRGLSHLPLLFCDSVYVIRKVMIAAFRKCNFYCNWVTESKVTANLEKFWHILVDFTMTSY